MKAFYQEDTSHKMDSLTKWGGGGIGYTAAGGHKNTPPPQFVSKISCIDLMRENKSLHGIFFMGQLKS